MQAYYGKLDAEAVTRYGLQCAMGSYQASKRGGDIFVVFKQARLQHRASINVGTKMRHRILSGQSAVSCAQM